MGKLIERPGGLIPLQILYEYTVKNTFKSLLIKQISHENCGSLTLKLGLLMLPMDRTA